MDTILEKAVGPENWYRDSQGLTTWLPGAFADQQSWGLAEAGFLCSLRITKQLDFLLNLVGPLASSV